MIPVLLEVTLSPGPGGLERLLQTLRRRQIRLDRIEASREREGEGLRVLLAVRSRAPEGVAAWLSKICDVKEVRTCAE